MSKAKMFLNLSKEHYNDLERQCMKVQSKVYRKAAAAARKGYKDYAFRVEDTELIPILMGLLKRDGFKVIPGPEIYDICIDWRDADRGSDEG